VLLAVPWVCTLSRRPPPRCLMCDFSVSDGVISAVPAVLDTCQLAAFEIVGAYI
jgi:hypothetical protein